MKRLRLWLSLSAGILAVVGTLFYLAHQGVFDDWGPAPEAAVRTGDAQAGSGPRVRGGVAPYPARAFELADLAGSKHRMAEFQGKVVLLHFWASWCPPCVEEIPELMKFTRKLADASRVVVVAVSMDRSWEDAGTVLKPKDLPANLVSLLDPRSEVPEKYGSYQFPETYLIDPELRVVAKWVGVQKWADPYYETEIRRLVAQ
ncbi:MAG TPA: TlpA disulfide reductase family protein [Bdellovibrionota bacterium]|nr:TlpA disulfide reductase family protein [Bdellovibrionota bacterium]